MTDDDRKDDEHPYEATAESGTEERAAHESGPIEEELIPPGSTADGAGTVLGGVPDEEKKPLGTGEDAGDGQLADEHTPGEDPLA